MPPPIKAQNIARMSGAPVPPRMPKAPQPKQMSNMAKSRAKGMAKRLITIGILLLTAALIAGIVYYVKFYGKQPKDALKKTIEYAYSNKYDAFRESFTEDSIALLEGSWSEAGDPWEHMMDGITPVEKPKILSEKIKDEKGFKTAELTVLIEDKEQTISMRQEDKKWKVNINVAINPRKLTLPPDINPKILDNFNLEEEGAPWWEADEETQNAKSSKGAGSGGGGKVKQGAKRVLGKMGCSRIIP